MVKRTRLLTILLTLFSIILFLFLILSNSWNYKYPNFIFNKTALLLIIGSILVFDIITFVLFAVTNNILPTTRMIIILPFVAILLFFTLLILSSTVGVFWESRINNYDDFSGTDSYLQVKIAGMTIDEIAESEIQNAEEFHYSYNSVLLSDSFEFKGKFVFSEKSYNDIKNAFLTAPEFSEVKYDTQKNSEYGMTGEFIIDTSIPKYETKTSVDKWDTVIIRFNDENFSFYFDLDGEYDI